jgi:hypothetical protein
VRAEWLWVKIRRRTIWVYGYKTGTASKDYVSGLSGLQLTDFFLVETSNNSSQNAKKCGFVTWSLNKLKIEKRISSLVQNKLYAIFENDSLASAVEEFV